MVNAYIVGAILAMALLANLTAARRRIDPKGWPFIGLVVSLVVLILFPQAWIAGLPMAARVLAGGLLLSIPVYFSGLLFVSLWAASAEKSLAFGSNLLGSLVGGVTSMLTMVVGFRALTMITLVVYLAFLLLLNRKATTA